ITSHALSSIILISLVHTPLSATLFPYTTLFRSIRALVLAGLPTTRTLMLRLATSLIALPCTEKMAALASSRSLRSMPGPRGRARSEEHTSELQSRENLVCRLLLEKKKKTIKTED